MTEPNSALPDDALEFAHQLLDGARTGATDFVTSAVDQGVPVDLADEKGNTLLMLASYHGHAALAAALVQRGADVNRENGRGQTPVAGAVFKRYSEITSTLIAAGADLDAGIPSARAAARMFEIDLDAIVASSTKLKG